jgi:hypothetical protein
MQTFLNDGYSLSKTFEAEKGRHNGFTLVYRPALFEERRNYQIVHTNHKERLAKQELDLFARHVVSIDGRPIKEIDPKFVNPLIVEKVIDLILSFEPHEEEQDAKNSVAG